jgi:type IV pilus assembly protein PilP
MTALFVLAGCGEGQEPLEQFFARTGAQVRGNVPSLPRLAPPEPVAYSAGALRDPFDPAVAVPAPAPREPRELGPLEAYGLDTLRMVGTIRADGERVALVRTPDGKLHHVRAGDRLGHHEGRVTRIAEAEIVLVESVAEGEERTAKLELRQ